MLNSLHWNGAANRTGPQTTWFDRCIFAVVNVWVYLAHPRFVRLYVRTLGRYPNIAKPTRVSELVQWRKLFDRNPLFCIFSDKLRAKQWVSERCPELKVAAPVWQGERPGDLPERYLSSACVIKTNHGSGQNYFPHRSKLPRREVERKFETWLGESLAKTYSEWAYGSVARKIFVEEFIDCDGPLMDISIRASDGHVPLASIDVDIKSDRHKLAYFWPDGSRCEPANSIIKAHDLLPGDVLPPAHFQQAVAYAKHLSRGIDYIRVDFFSTGRDLYFGEMTVYPASGFGREGPIGEIVFGTWIRHVRQGWFFRQKHNPFMRLYRDALERHFYTLSLRTPDLAR